MKKLAILFICAFSVVLFSCVKISKHTKVEIFEEEPSNTPVRDTIAAPVDTGRTEKSSSYDNMRGFDPASEDDTEDNGMSRYMENDDDDGWN